MARWKYHAIGSASAIWITVEVKSSSAAPITNRVSRNYEVRNPPIGDILDEVANQSHVETKLRRSRRKREIEGGRVEVAERLAKWVHRLTQDGHCDAGNRDHGKKGELEAGFEQGSRIHQQDTQGSNGRVRERGALAKQQTREQVNPRG